MSTLLTRLRHWRLGLHLLPSLLSNSSHQRALLGEMRKLSSQLPTILKQPLPQAMSSLKEIELKRPYPLPPEAQTRQLADLAALLDRNSPLGLCLRRSLLRYRYLHELNVPVTVLFGAKFALGESPSQKKITGHAWLTQANQPYHEDDENWQGYTVMLRWPKPNQSASGNVDS